LRYDSIHHTFLWAISAAAALRSESALWQAFEQALDAGASQADVEATIETAAETAAEAVRTEAKKVLNEVLARQGARERWGLIKDEDER
jgi:alkylhydroperoxidase/carboxymuconolactone decarboxylase family protein YurZ